tara:strand:+ start:10731 stop:12953 length:2223 start_codon:yes stop_codon:yes gene_type:complete
MKLRWKIQLALFLIAMLPFLIAGLLGYAKARQTLEDRFLLQLDSVASIQAARVTDILNQKLEKVRLLSGRPQLRSALMNGGISRGGGDVEATIAQVIRAGNLAHGLISVSVYDSNGSLIASTKAAPETLKDISRKGYFETALDNPVIGEFYPGTDGELTTMVIGPVASQGSVLGVVAAEIDASELVAVVASREGLGETGELILARAEPDGSATFLTPTRFDPKAAFSRTVQETGNPIIAALSKSGEANSNVVDYRGEKVLSVARSIELGRLGLEAKVDRSEALGPIVRLRRLTVVIACLTVVMVGGVSWFLASTILRPVERLTRSAHIIESGDYDHRAVVDGRDEIADLADAFNLMAKQLTVANRSLEETVEKRTAQLQSSKERFELAVSGSAAGIWDWDINSNHVYFSDRFKELLGYQPDEFEDSFEAWESRLHPEEKGGVLEALQSHVQNGNSNETMFDQEFRLRLRDGNYRWFHTRGRAVRGLGEGAPTRMAGSITDVDSRKQYEARLEHSVRELEQFAYVASHDLREPLRMVASYVKLLERRYKDKLDDSAQDFINYAVDGANRMQRLINDLLTYSRVGSKQQDLQPIHAEQVMNDALKNLQEAIRESGAEVTHDPLPMVSADQTQFVQLMQNLLANAIKFTQPGQTPKVHVSAKPRDGKWCFSVRDNGIGIKKDYKERIFKIFQRLNSREEYEGTGIGLAVVNKIVERHGGSIWLESEEGSGTTFYFTMRGAMTS